MVARRPLRPVSLRPATWAWLPGDVKQRIDRGEPVGPLVLEVGILEHPELLRDTVIEFENGVEYVIPESAAKQLASASRGPVSLRRIYDAKERVASRDEVLKAIRDWSVFDQLEDKRR